MRLNVPIALASLMLSIMLWLVVYAQNVPEPTPFRAPLSLDGLDDGKFFVRKSPTDVRLDMSIPSDRAKELRDQQVAASVDLSQPKVGTHDYPVTITPAWAVGFLAQPRPLARITIEPIESRVIKVTSVVKGVLNDPLLKLNERQVLPPEVTVKGPASEVATIREARAYLDLSHFDTVRPEYQESEVIPLDGRETRPQHVRATPGVVLHKVSVGPSPTTKVATVVPDLTGVTYAPTALPNGWDLDPKFVTLTGKPAVLANVSKVPTEVVRVRGLARTQTFRVRLVAPPGTMIVGSEICNVTVRAVPAQPPKTEPGDDGAPTSAGGAPSPR